MFHIHMYNIHVNSILCENNPMINRFDTGGNAAMISTVLLVWNARGGLRFMKRTVRCMKMHALITGSCSTPIYSNLFRNIICHVFLVTTIMCWVALVATIICHVARLYASALKILDWNITDMWLKKNFLI